jgi:hypothetical protein
MTHDGWRRSEGLLVQDGFEQVRSAKADQIAALKRDIDVQTRDLENLKSNFIDWDTP